MEMEYVQQRKKPQKKTDIKPNRTGIPQQIKQQYSEKQENLGALAYTQEDKMNLRTEQEEYLQHKLAYIVQQKRDFEKSNASADNLSVQDRSDLEQITDNTTTILHRQQNCTEAVIQRIPTPGDVAAVRFSQLVDWNYIQGNIQHPNIIQQELIDVGIPQNIAQNIANNYLNSLPNFILPAIKVCFQNLIQHEYDQITNNTLGADYNPNQQPTPLLTILTTVLTNRYLPIIRQPIAAGAPRPIQFNIRGQIGQDLQRQIAEGIGRINKLLDPNLRQQLPRGANQPAGAPLPVVDIGDDIDFGGSTTAFHDINRTGEQDYGLFAGPSQVMHEQGHHIENYLGVNDFVNLHYYLYRHTNPTPNAQDRRSGWNKLFGFEKNIMTGGPGYNIHLPEMKFQNIISRNLPSGNDLMLYWLFNAGNAALYEILSLFGAQERGQQFIDDFFLQESNSNSTSYASLYDPETYETEFMSTTAELLSTARGAQEVINNDPTRVVLFIYLTNRPLYQQINGDFQQAQQNQNPIDLDAFMHII